MSGPEWWATLTLGLTMGWCGRALYDVIALLDRAIATAERPDLARTETE